MQTQVKENPLPRPAKENSPSRGVRPLNERARRLERRVTLATVLLPYAGLVGGILLFWNRGVNRLDLAVFGVMYCVTVLGIGMGFHRLMAHRAYQATTFLKTAIVIAGSMAAQGPVIFWTAVHRRHHSYSDREGDPHSPHLHGEGAVEILKGLWHSHMGWLFNHELTDWGTYVRDLLHDRLIFKLNRLYFLWIVLGLLLPAAAEGLITMSWQGFARGFLWGGLIRVLVVHHTTWSINSVCHVFGSQPYQVKDHSTNNVILAIPTFGESWHNNHHAFPSSAVHGLEWWQVDITGSMIKLCAMLGLASSVKIARKKQPEVDLNQKPA
ncbi:MAG TPA: acyl-CoA desaturase [Candidatus Angelobacter sp.]|nr:acyl-CoA desaturase [Candidatus Angelobacter sp.]